MRIDTHVHFWDWNSYSASPWLQDKPLLHRSYLPDDLKPHMDSCGVDRAVIVEAGRDDHERNLWWLKLAKEHEHVGSVVLGCMLEQENLTEWLDDYAKSQYFVGVRTAPAGPPEEWMENAASQRGLKELEVRDLCLDLLVGYEAYPAVAQMAARYPNLRMNLNHCANPPIRDGKLDIWREMLTPLASYQNIHIKYSSSLLYIYPDIAQARVQPVADFLFEHFGVKRMMWGSNWPVELLGGTYEEAFEMMQRCAPTLSETEKVALYGGNAELFYRVR